MTFYVTFGQKYRHEDHPYYGHPDGWSEVLADDYETARVKVVSRYGTKWCMMYSEEEFAPHRHLYPNGLIERFA